MKAKKINTSKTSRGKSNPKRAQPVRAPIIKTKRALKKNASAQLQVENIIERVNDGFVAFDEKMNYIYVNTRGGELLGRKSEDLIGKNYWKEYPEAKGTPFANAYVRAIETQEAIVFEDYYEPFDRWFENRIYPSKDGLSIFFTEITERKKFELNLENANLNAELQQLNQSLEEKVIQRTNELREIELFMHQTINNALDAFVTMNDQGVILSWNHQAEKIFGWTSEQAVGRLMEDTVIPPIHREAHRHGLKHFLNTGKGPVLNKMIEITALHRDGHEFDVELSILPIERHGRFTFSAFIRDITERKQAEQKARYHANLVVHVSDAIISTDVNFTIRSWNNAAEEIYGWREDEVIGKSVNEIIPPEYLDDDGELVVEKFRKNGYWKGEVVQKRKDGVALFILSSVSLIHDGEGNPSGAVAVNRDITDRKQAEEALIANELRFRSLIEHGLDSISLITADGTLIWESPSAAHILGYEFNQYLGKSIFELVHPDDLERTTQQFQELLKQPDGVRRQSFRLRHANGNWLWIEGVGTNLLDEPSVNAIVVNYRDITERKTASDALIRREHELSLAQSVGSMGSWEIILADGKLTWSDELYRIFGLEVQRQDMTESELLAMIHPDDRERHNEFIAQFVTLREKEGQSSLDYRIIRTDGVERHVQTRVKTASDEYGNIVRLFGTVQDITESKLAEEKLRESEERFRNILENLEDGYYEVDLKGNFTFFNPAYSRTLGYDQEEMMGMNYRQYMSPETAASVFEVFNRVYKTGIPEQAQSWQFIRRDGTLLHMEISISLIKGPDGKIGGFRGIVRNVTERKQAEEILLESENKFRTLTESSPMGIFMDDAQGKAIYINDRCAELVGVSAEQALNLDWVPLIHPDDREHVTSQWMKAVSSGASFKEDYRWVHADGKVVWTHGEISPVRDAKGNVSLFIGVLIDITERKQAEEELVKSEERYRALFENSPIAIWEQDSSLVKNYLNELTKQNVTDLQAFFETQPDELAKMVDMTKYLYANKATFKLYRAKTMEDIFDGFPNGISSDSKQYFLQEFENIAKGQHEFKWTGKDIRADNEIFDYELNWAVVPGHEGDYSKVLVSMIDITELKQAERALQQNQLRYQNIVENLNQAYFEADRRAVMTYCNPGLLIISRYSEQELIGRVSFRIIVEEHRQQVIDTYRSMLKRKQTHLSTEFKVRTKYGREFWVEQTTHFEFDTNGKFIKASNILKDIDERKQTEETLRQSESFRKLIIETEPECVKIVASDGSLIDMNRAGLDMIEADSLGDVKGRAILDIVAPEYRKAFSDLHKMVMAGESGKLLFEIIGIKGTHRWLETHAVPLINSQQETISLLGVTRDVTERKRAEENLRYNQTLLLHVLDTSPAVIFVKDEDSTILLANKKMASFYNLSVEQVIGRRQADLHLELGSNPKEIEQWLVDDKEVIQSGQIKRIEETGTDTAGNLRWFETTKYPINLGMDKRGVLVLSEDITERKKAQETIEQYAAELEQRVLERTVELTHANRAKDEFLANMSHELRTPLNSILGMSESLLEQGRETLSDKQKQYLQLVYSSGSHLLSLITDILDVSKIEAGKLDLRSEEISVKEVCESSLTFVKEAAIKKFISLEFQLEPDISTVRADPIRLKQIIINLLSNAVKFTPQNGSVRLAVSLNEQRDKIHFSVEDTGIGIAQDDLSKLFIPFTQLDSSMTRHHEGTGLGLVLVYRLTELHGGSVRVESEPNQGSRFTVILPWQEDKNKTRKTKTKASPAKDAFDSSSNTHRDKVILLAEDHESNIYIVSDYLVSQGFQVVVARNGVEAIAMTEESSPHLILMDIQMPIMDGLEATRRLRADPRFVSVPIIALTALAMPGDRERCLEAGANHYMSKPVSLKLLANTIRDLLHLKT